MSTININSMELQVVYIDPNVPYINNTQTEGTGATPADPLFNFPSDASAYPENVIFLVRRSANNYGASVKNVEISGVSSLAVWGMPVCPYQPTTHTTAQAGTTYYKCDISGDDVVFSEVTVAAGTEIPTHNQEDLTVGYYELKESVNGTPLTELGGKLWSSIPKEAKVRWFDAVTINNQLNTNMAFRANIQHTIDSAAIVAENCAYFDLRNININTCMTSYSRNWYTFNLGSSSVACTLNVDLVHFRCASNITSGVPSFYTDGVQVNSNSNSGCWIKLNADSNFSTSATITNSKVEAAGRRDESNDGQIDFGKCASIMIDNVDVSVLQGSQSPVFHTRTNGESSADLVVRNLHAKYYYGGSNAYSSRINNIISGGVKTANISNCSYKKAPTQYWDLRYDVMEMYAFINLTVLSAGSDINNIEIEYPDFAGQCSGAIEITYDSSYTNAQEGQYTKLSDISITCADATAPALRESNQHDNINIFYWNSESALMEIRRSSVNNGPSTDFLLQNINIRAPYGKAVYAHAALLDLNSNTIKGAMRLYKCMGKIGKLEHYRPGNIFWDDGGNTLYIGSIVCDRTGKLFDYSGESALYIEDWQSYILVGNCNTEFISNVGNTDSLYNCSYICTNNASFNGAGNYSVRTQRAFCTTWSINRAQSNSGCSLKLYNETSVDTNYPLRVGGAPFKGITKHVTAGAHTIKIYAITNGYTYPQQIANNLIITMKANGRIYTSTPTMWAEDTESTWNNIESGSAKAFVFSMDFTADSEQDIEFEYAFSWFMIGGAVYLDPHPTIE